MDLMSKIVSLCKRRGFIFQSSEIYGGIEGFWDAGPLGALLKENIKNFWLQKFVQKRDDIVLIDGTVILNPKVWQASGHLKNFTDPLVECKNCHKRFRADHLIENLKKSVKLDEHGVLTEEELKDIKKAIKKVKCPECQGALTDLKQFNLMFKSFVGPLEDKAHEVYLRPETAQSMFTNFKNIQETMRLKLPFGIAQIGRCFRNEITTGNYTFRSKEFDIAEIEYFVAPGEDEKVFDEWLNLWEEFFLESGLKKENLRRHEHPKKDLAHYSKRTVDIEYKFPFGWSELAGIANRTDFDLSQHSKASGEDLKYFDPSASSGQAPSARSSAEAHSKSSGRAKNKKYFPYVIEPTLGIDRAMLALLIDAYREVKGGRTKTTESTKEQEVILGLNKKIAPIKVAVLPLVRNKPELVKKAREIYDFLRPYFYCQYDELGSIGRRYRRQDEIGTVFSVTADFETLEKEDITVRDRDTMKQERVKIENLTEYLKEKLEN